MEFDKSRVFSAVNADELKTGDKVIVADTLDLIAMLVNTGKGEYWVIEEINPENFKNRFKARLLYHSCINKDYCYSFAFAYLVERKENCTNCSGRITCVRQKPEHPELTKCCNYKRYECSEYKPITEQKAEKHTDYNHCEEAMISARLKKHYRPFKDVDELIKVWIAKRMVTYPDLCLPHIWVRLKECNKGGLLITYFGEDEVKTDEGFLTMSKLLNAYTFTDGSPCGVEE